MDAEENAKSEDGEGHRLLALPLSLAGRLVVPTATRMLPTYVTALVNHTQDTVLVAVVDLSLSGGIAASLDEGHSQPTELWAASLTLDNIGFLTASLCEDIRLVAEEVAQFADCEIPPDPVICAYTSELLTAARSDLAEAIQLLDRMGPGKNVKMPAS